MATEYQSIFSDICLLNSIIVYSYYLTETV